MSETGGHAFPCNTYNGMTLRDYFAAQASPAIAKHSIGIDTEVLRKGMELYECATVESFVAKVSYMYADAMLEARKQ